MRNVLLAGALALGSAAASAQSLQYREEGDVRWVCGGVGTSEREALAALEPQANLKLLFVTAKRSGYLADVSVALFAAGAAAPRLEVTAEGPICLVRAPAGRYRVEASLGGVKRAATVSIAQDARQPARLAFSFPGEPWDGIWADEEEKRQGRER